MSNGRIHQSYFENQLKILKSEYKESISIEDFYRYYRTGRTDRDHCYFRLGQINPDENPDTILTNGDTSKDISWTNSQNALIELIYAIYASCSVSHGKIGIRKLALIFQVLLRTPLNDIHHSFHRMKTRAGSRTAFLDQLKTSLEEYMDKDL